MSQDLNYEEQNRIKRVDELEMDAYSQNEVVVEKKFKPPSESKSISWRWPILFVGFCCLLYYMIHLNDHILPDVISEEEAIANPKLFSGERSRGSLRRLTAIGPRMTGHISNEQLAPELIEAEVRQAIREAHPSQNILVQRQKGSGAYELRHKIPFTNIYVNVQNVVVLVEGSEGSHSILVNCHYDTVPEVEGAADDGISCAVMLELVRVLAASDKRLTHNVVFLFNGAEEASLQGSHLFMQHEWKNKSRIILNLEAAGMGGRSILFQSGPENPWILQYYAKYVPHPHALVLAEEMFEAGYIPSDTDFRIFRDFGKLPGLDMAFSRSGHVYHTKYDREIYMPTGSHQHMGDNTLALLQSIGNAKELFDMQAYSKGKMVYYDYLGWFMVSYPQGGGIALNIFIIILAIFSIVIYVGRLLNWKWLPESTPIEGKNFEKITMSSFAKKFTKEANKKTEESQNSANDNSEINDVRAEGTNTDSSKKSKKKAIKSLDYYKLQIHNLNTDKAVLIELGIFVCVRMIAMGAAIAVTSIFGLIVNSAATLAMPWYSNVWLLFPLYWCPCLVTYAMVPHFADLWRSKKHKMNMQMTTQMNLIAVQILFIIMFFVMTCAGIRSAAILLLPVLCGAIANLVIYLTPLYKTGHVWIWVYLAIHIPSLLMNMYYTLMGYVIFNPVMGRSGVINGDLYIALVSSILCIFLSSYAIPLMMLVRKPGLVFSFFMTFSIFMMILSLNTEIGHPYSAGPENPSPQRYWIMHTSREFRNQTGHVRRADSGYFLLNLDINSPRTAPLKTRNAARSLAPDCRSELHCGLPLWMTRMVPLSPTSSWIIADMPNIPEVTGLTKIGNRDCRPTLMTCTFNFDVEGPDRITITFAPKAGATLDSWSVPTEPTTSEIRDGKPFYFLHIVRGYFEDNYKLSLTFKVNQEQLQGAPVFDIGVAGNHVHHHEYRTKAFQSFLDSFPDWVDRFGWISAYKGYEF